MSLYDFNTSHVSINPSLLHILNYSIENFNTSHVSINPFSADSPKADTTISIHLMFLLIPYRGTYAFYPCSISIHLMFLLIDTSKDDNTGTEEFQYISCFY